MLRQGMQCEGLLECFYRLGRAGASGLVPAVLHYPTEPDDVTDDM